MPAHAQTRYAISLEKMSEALADANKAIELDPKEPDGYFRRADIYNEMGIPALTYGPPGRAGTGAYAVSRADLTDAARVYALTALALCS